MTLGCALAWTASTLAAGGADDDEAAGQIRAAVYAEAALGFSGAVLVVRGDRVLVEGTFGALNGAPLPPDGRFLIASAAKQFTSAALLRLQDQGRLELDDPIARHLAGVPADKSSITIRQLLAHTSGLPEGYASEGAANWKDAAAAILKVPLAAVPGEKFQYSNDNYALGVILVEAVTGRRYGDFVREELLEPAGLRDTGQLEGPGTLDRLAPIAGTLPPRLLEQRWGGSGYYTTTRDFLAWYRALRGAKLLRPASVEELFAPVAKTGEGQSALGWFLGATPTGEARIFTRGNEDFGANCAFYAYPRTDTVIIVLSHSGQKDDETSWSRAVHGRIESLLFGGPGG